MLHSEDVYIYYSQKVKIYIHLKQYLVKHKIYHLNNQVLVR